MPPPLSSESETTSVPHSRLTSRSFLSQNTVWQYRVIVCPSLLLIFCCCLYKLCFNHELEVGTAEWVNSSCTARLDHTYHKNDRRGTMKAESTTRRGISHIKNSLREAISRRTWKQMRATISFASHPITLQWSRCSRASWMNVYSATVSVSKAFSEKVVVEQKSYALFPFFAKTVWWLYSLFATAFDSLLYLVTREIYVLCFSGLDPLSHLCYKRAAISSIFPKGEILFTASLFSLASQKTISTGNASMQHEYFQLIC